MSTQIEISLLNPESGQMERRSFAQIGSYGYVWETTHQPGTLGSQVCERLAGCGSALSCRPDADALRRLIRREQRRRLREWRRHFGAEMDMLRRGMDRMTTPNELQEPIEEDS
jgi:hypothetical protein